MPAPPCRWAATARAPAGRAPSVQAPSPVSASARSASGPRSDWPSEPVVRTRGARPALSAATRWSASSGRTPERPRPNPASWASIAARTTSSGASGPVPVRCESSSSRLNAAWSRSPTATRLSAPTPVVSPYTRSPRASSAAVTSRPAAIRSPAAGASSTGRWSRATATTSARVRRSSRISASGMAGGIMAPGGTGRRGHRPARARPAPGRPAARACRSAARASPPRCRRSPRR